MKGGLQMGLSTETLSLAKGKVDFAMDKVSLQQNLMGRVVDHWEYNGYDDSDFYVIFVNDAGEYVSMEYNSTRYAGGSWLNFKDESLWASAEDVQKYEDWSQKVTNLNRLKNGNFKIGDLVKVVKGRKSVGKTGPVVKVFTWRPYSRPSYRDVTYIVFEDGEKINVANCEGIA